MDIYKETKILEKLIVSLSSPTLRDSWGKRFHDY
jgi:hypothetical protein